MSYSIRGGKPFTVDPNDYKRGGEAKVFINNGVVYKIYHKPGNMIPEAKILELQKIKIPNVIKPQDIIIDGKNTICGFTMSLAEGVVFSKLYTNGFRKDNNITEDMITQLVLSFQETVHKAHSDNFLIVDINALNIIVELSSMLPQFIDVNSWQTPSFPATAINPHVKDYHASKFSKMTDWFSVGILTFILYVGVHPFRGGHPNYKRDDTVKRMKENASAFDDNTRLPPSARGLDAIPKHYRDWYIKLFKEGKRCEPPHTPGTVEVVSVKVQVVQSTNNFEITLIKEFDDDILFHREVFGREITRTTKSIYINNADYQVSDGVDIVMTPKNIIPLLVKVRDDKILFKSLDTTKNVKAQEFSCSHIIIVDNLIYGVYDGVLTLYGISEIGNNVIISKKESWTVMRTSIEYFNTMLFQEVLGKPFLVIPYKGGCYSIPVPEIKGYRVVEAKHCHGMVSLIATKNGTEHDRIEIRFDGKFKSYDLKIVENIDYNLINFTVLPSGLVIIFNNDDSLSLFKTDPTSPDGKKIVDPDIQSDMRLCNYGTEVRFFKGKSLYNFKMKGK